MKLTIVTICFRDLAGLKKTIESLLKQSSFEFEHWIIDGGSNDGTPEYLTNLQVPWKLNWISEKDKGLYDAMNKGLERASGEYIWYLNSGDVANCSDVVRTVLESIQANPDIDLFYGNAWYESTLGRRHVGRDVTASDFVSGMAICHQACIYRTSLNRRFPYPLDFRIISDWIVTQKIFESGAKTKYIDFYIAVFDLTGVSATNHFKVFKEKLRSEKSALNKIKVTCTLGIRFLGVWVLKQIGLYESYRRLYYRH